MNPLAALADITSVSKWPVTTLFWLVFAAVLVASGYHFGYRSANNYAISKIAALADANGKLQFQSAQLQTDIATQNAAVEHIKADADARSKAAQAALAQAKLDTAKINRVVTKILSMPVPAGVSPCVAASSVFDSVITQERAQ